MIKKATETGNPLFLEQRTKKAFSKAIERIAHICGNPFFIFNPAIKVAGN